MYSSNSGSTWTTYNDGVGAATTAGVIGLTLGQSYIFRVAAKNSVGTGPFSANSTAVTPRTLAGIPTGLAGFGSNREALLKWDAPSSNGGSQITGYKVQYSTDSGVTWTNTAYDYGSSAIVPNLTNGTSYIFRVAAKNAAGTGSYSANSNPVIPATFGGTKNLFDKRSWSGSDIATKYKSALDAAADAWEARLSYYPDLHDRIRSQYIFWYGRNWNGLEMGSFIVESKVWYMAACGVGEMEYGMPTSFSLWVNSDYAGRSLSEWTGVMIHELGHALGVGTLWQTDGNHFITGYGQAQDSYNSRFNVTRDKIPLLDSWGGSTTADGAVDGHWSHITRTSDGLSYPSLTADIMSYGVRSAGITPVTVSYLSDIGWLPKLSALRPGDMVSYSMPEDFKCCVKPRQQ
jgi:hypothetical protein